MAFSRLRSLLSTRPDSIDTQALTSLRFGEPISMKDYESQFLSDVDGEPRAAVKRLTQCIEQELTRATINAPDW